MTGLFIIWAIIFVVAWIITFFSFATEGVDSIWALLIMSFFVTVLEIAFLLLVVWGITSFVEAIT